MKKLLFAMLFLPFPLAALAQAPAVEPAACEAKAIDKNGKPLAGAAKGSFIKKCEKDAHAAMAKTACEAKALSKEGKPLAGAAKASSVKKCMAETR